VVGGRQSAFETAALLADAGAARVDVVHRHETPSFTAADWSFVDALLMKSLAAPGWFRSLDADSRAGIEQQFWAEGRLKLEPWLPPRLDPSIVHSRPRSEVVDCRPEDTGLVATLSDGSQLEVDLLVLGTGYRPDLATLRFLSPLRGRIATQDGFPVLDQHMQSTVPGLFLTGFLATRDFGPFFGFVRGAPAAAHIIVSGLMNRAPAGLPS
jgi:thioredoxin reductase